MTMYVALLALAACLGQVEEEFASSFDAFTRQRDEIQSLQARFVQKTMTPEETIESEGSIVFVHPKRIIFRYDEPKMEYMIDRDHAYEYDAELEQILIYDISGRPEAEAFFMGFENNTDQIEKAYDTQLLPAINPSTHAFGLELKPRPLEDDEAIFESVTLQMRHGDFMPTEILIVNDAEASVLFKISGFVLNDALDQSLSHVFAPPGTDVVYNDEALDPVGDEGRHYPVATDETLLLPEVSSLDPAVDAEPLETVKENK